MVLDEIQSMDNIYSDVLIMKYKFEYTVPEIAQALNLNEKTVYTRLERGRKLLRKRLEKLEEIANSFEGVDKSFAIQAGREIRILVKPENVNDADTIIMAKDIVKRIETELEYPGQIKVNVIRETRAVEFAK